MAEVRLTLEEYEALRRMITSERESEGAALAQAKKPKRRKKNKKLSLKKPQHQLLKLPPLLKKLKLKKTT